MSASILERLRRPAPEQFSSLAPERQVLWDAIADGQPASASKTVYTRFQVAPNEEEGNTPIGNDYQRSFANVLRRYKDGHLSPLDEFWVSFSMGKVGSAYFSALDIVVFPHYQAWFAGDLEKVPVLFFRESGTKKEYILSIRGEGENIFTSDLSQEIDGIDSTNGLPIWVPARDYSSGLPEKEGNIVQKQELYRGALSLVTKQVKVSNFLGRLCLPEADISFNERMHDYFIERGLVRNGIEVGSVRSILG